MRAGDDAWPVREGFLGWTADHAAVYRTAICDPDEGGGRGAYCDVNICALASGGEPACTPALMLTMAEGQRRGDIDDAAVETEVAAALAALGPLTAGTRRPISIVTVDVGAHPVTLTVPGRAGPRAVVAADNTSTDAEWDVDASVLDVALSHVVASDDGACVAVLGHSANDGYYEGVRYASPATIAAVYCD